MASMQTARLEGAELIKCCVLLTADQLSLYVHQVDWNENLNTELERYTLNIDVTANSSDPSVKSVRNGIAFPRATIENFITMSPEIGDTLIRTWLHSLQTQCSDRLDEP